MNDFNWRLKSRIVLVTVISLGFLSLTPTSSRSEDITNRVHAQFYLDTQTGCYSASYISVRRVPMKAIHKLYPVSCFQPHHYEVYWAGQFPFKEKNLMAQGRRAVEMCSKKSTNPIYFRSPNSYNYSPDEQVFIGNWMADLGPEYKRYKNKIVCYVVLGTKSTRYIKEVDKPLIAGIETYVN
jgi:hypothetical protein